VKPQAKTVHPVIQTKFNLLEASVQFMNVAKLPQQLPQQQPPLQPQQQLTVNTVLTNKKLLEV
jgi:hypothetical protein